MVTQLIIKYVHAILNLTNNTTKPKLQVNIIKLSSIFGAFVTHKCTVYVASVTVAKATFINHNVHINIEQIHTWSLIRIRINVSCFVFLD